MGDAQADARAWEVLNANAPASRAAGIRSDTSILAAMHQHAAEQVAQALAQREGWRLVPVEPTEAMLRAGEDADIPGGRWGTETFRESSVEQEDIAIIWSDMLTAAPTPQGEKEGA